MIQLRSHHTPTTQHYTTRLVTLAVLPLAIYLLQVLGKVYSFAAITAGVLVFIKVLIDLLTSLPVAPRHTLIPHHTYRHQSPPCHLCGQANRRLVPHSFDSRTLWVCQDCLDCIAFTEQYV